MSRDAYQLQGGNGFEVIDDTAAHTNNGEGFVWVSVANDAVLTTVAGTDLTNAAGLAGITLPAGFGFGGRISTITLTSGVVIAYKP